MVERSGTTGTGIVGSLNSLAFPQSNLYAALGGYPSNTGVPVTPLTSLQAAAVYACVKCVSEDIAGLDVVVRKKQKNGARVVDYDHPLMRNVFRKPNDWQIWLQMIGYLLVGFCLRGNGYIVVNRNRYGEPESLIPVSPDLCTPRLSTKGRLWYNVNTRILPGVLVVPDDMIHLKNFSLDGYMGVSPITCGQDVIGLALATQQHGAVLFRQGGQASGVITFPGVMGKEATDNVAQSWKETHSGVQNAHKVVVLEEAGKFEKISLTQEEAQFLETREFQVVDICSRMFRVPPHKLGVLGRATYSNIEQMQQQYIDDGLSPITKQLQGLMVEHLLFEDERDDHDITFDYTSMLRGDMLTRYQAYQIGLMNGIVNRNEVRQRENMNPVEGGDDFRVPLNTGDPEHPETLPQQHPDGTRGDGGGGQDDGLDVEEGAKA